MRAVRLHDTRDLRVEDVDPPGPPSPGEVRIRVRAAGICGSDLHNYATGQWITRRPSVAGHEFCGVVAAVGEGVEDFSVGDPVVADSRVWCGHCAACRAGLRQVCERLGFVGEACDGGFAEEVRLPARLVHPHPRGLSPEIACLAEPLAVALHAVRRLAPVRGEPVLVVGCGAIGGLAAVLLHHLHETPVLVCDRSLARAETVATIVGGTPVDLSAGSLRDVAGGLGPRAAIDATGSVAVLEALVALLPPASRTALVGIAHGSLELDPNRLVERELALLGCHAFGDEMPEAIALLPTLGERIVRLVGDRVSLGEVPDAYDRLIAGTASGPKTVIRVS